MTLAELEAALTLDLRALAKKCVAENRNPEDIRKNAKAVCARIDAYLRSAEAAAVQLAKGEIFLAGGIR